MMLITIQTKVATRIKTLLAERNMTQRELADKLWISESTVNRWVNDNRMPSVENIYAMSRIFNTTTDYIIGASDERNRNA